MTGGHGKPFHVVKLYNYAKYALWLSFCSFVLLKKLDIRLKVNKVARDDDGLTQL